jgi:hypothetical protein
VTIFVTVYFSLFYSPILAAAFSFLSIFSYPYVQLIYLQLLSYICLIFSIFTYSVHTFLKLLISATSVSFFPYFYVSRFHNRKSALVLPLACIIFLKYFIHSIAIHHGTPATEIVHDYPNSLQENVGIVY